MTIRLEDRVKEVLLPEGMEWYREPGGARVFPLYGGSGGITATYVGYLIDRGPAGTKPTMETDLGLPNGEVVDMGNGWRSFCVALEPYDESTVIERVKDAIAILRPRSDAANE